MVSGPFEPGVGRHVRQVPGAGELAQRLGEGLHARRVKAGGDRSTRQIAQRERPRPQATGEHLCPDGAGASVGNHPHRPPAVGGFGLGPGCHLQREGRLGALDERVPGVVVVAQSLQLRFHGGYLRIPLSVSTVRRRRRASRSAVGRRTMRRAGSRSSHSAPKPRLCS